MIGWADNEKATRSAWNKPLLNIRLIGFEPLPSS
jgi:hypothetical protein